MAFLGAEGTKKWKKHLLWIKKKDIMYVFMEKEENN
jgi:hypothetical protein